MATLKTLVFLQGYEGSPSAPCSSNSPSKIFFKWTRETQSTISQALSETFQIAPGASQTLFSGTVALTQDNTTTYSLALAQFQSSIYQLTNTGGTAPTFRTLRSIGADATTQVTTSLNGPILTYSAPGTYASFTGLVSGLTTSVTITANTLGVTGNSASLTGDGTSSITLLITNWNIANPSNQMTLTTGDGTQIPAVSTVIQLSGGSTPFNLSSAQVGDDVLIGTNFNQLNQGSTGIWQIVSLTSTSFSVVNPTGYIQGPITLGSGYATQIRIFSSAGVQIGDTVVISSGFSPVSWGSYQITLVTDNTLQFSFLGSLPSETNILSEVAVYSMAKTLVYMESDQNLTVTLNGGSPGPTIVPIVANGSVYPGMFLLNGVTYSLSVTNNSITTANVTLLSAE
jgi:hypothetical protein